jgi:ethanolamine utilization microcompartment shell protein EutL
VDLTTNKINRNRYRLNKTTPVPIKIFGSTNMSESESGFSAMPRKIKKTGRHTTANNTNEIKYRISLKKIFIPFSYLFLENQYGYIVEFACAANIQPKLTLLFSIIFKCRANPQDWQEREAGNLK